LALIFVTGARGAIGRHVVTLARARGDTVAGVGHGAWSGDNGLPQINYWINGGINADNLTRLVRDAGPPDAIIHLAGGSLVGTSMSSPAEDFRRTVTASQRLLEWQRTDAAQARLVIASSAAVYGDGHTGRIAETAHIAPTSPYGTHKAMVEMLARSYARQFGIRATIVRLFSVYGPGLRKQLIWDIASRLAVGEPHLTLGGSGKECRDFVYIVDAAAMLLDAAELADTTAPIFNGCGGEGVEISSLADLIGGHFARATFDFSGRVRLGDPRSLVGEASVSRRAGLLVKTALTTGIATTINWIKGLPQAELS
jgi:UDP-glucose 4-epimerase